MTPAAPLVAALEGILDPGASHLQPGKDYPYLNRLGAAAADTVAGIKRALDPRCRVNPGALGLWPAAEGATHEREGATR